MKTKFSIILFLLLATVNVDVSAQRRAERRSIGIRDFELVRERGQVTVDFTLVTGDRAAASGNTLVIIPILTNDGIVKELTPVVVRGRRAQILYERRFIASRRTADTVPEAMAVGNGESLKYRVVMPFEEWMTGASLRLDGVDEGCRSAVRTDLGIVADNLMVPRSELEQVAVVTTPAPEPETELSTGDMLAGRYRFVRPAAGERYSREGATVHFRQGSHDINRDYRGNRRSLDDIISAIEDIRSSADSEVESIVIAGFASPEGSAQHNERISEQRARAVRQLIFDNSAIQADRLKIHVGGEDWEGLRAMVATSDMPYKDAVLDIIDNVPVWDSLAQRGRETELMNLRGGVPYRYMYDNFFPELREAAYITIYYRNK